MKSVLTLLLLASPAAAQDFAVRATDTVPNAAALADTILDRDLEYFDGGVSRYASDGSYAWTYSETNGGSVHTGQHVIGTDGTVCITYDAGAERCDMFVMAGDRLVLLTDTGERYPLRRVHDTQP